MSSMAWKMGSLILLLYATIGYAEDGPTLLPPRPITSAPPPANSGQENVETLPTPRPVPVVTTPAPNVTEGGGKAYVPPDISELIRETDALKAEREKLQSEHDEMSQPMQRADESHASDILKLRLRLAALLTNLGTQRNADESKGLAKSVPGPGRPPRTSIPEHDKSVIPPLPKPPQSDQHPAASTDSDKPLEPLALARALFRTGDYEGALTAYRLINVDTVSKQDRVAVQYMEASCLRKLGKTDQAATLYREVTNSKDDEVLAECAQWQLGALQWRRELETSLQQLRQRRQALEIKP